MVKVLLDLPENENRVVNIVKAMFDLSNKVDAILFIIREYERSSLGEGPSPMTTDGEGIGAMRRARREYEAYERELSRRERPDPRRNLKVFGRMLAEAKSAGSIPTRDPLEGIEVDIKVSKVVNHG